MSLTGLLVPELWTLQRAGTAHVSADLVMWQLGANSNGIAGTVCSS